MGLTGGFKPNELINPWVQVYQRSSKGPAGEIQNLVQFPLPKLEKNG